MLTTLDRYLLREVTQTWVVVTGVLLAIMLSSRFARYLGEAAAGGLPSEAVFALLSLTSIHYLTVLVPVSLFLAVMLALGRWYRDSEMVALMACGVGYGRMLRPLLGLATVVAIGLAVLSMVVGPWSAAESHEVRERAEREAEAAGFEAGRFRSGGGTVFYAEEVARGGRELQRVFIQHRDGDQVTVSRAARGEQYLDRETGARHLLLFDGRRYTGDPGSAEYQVVEFSEHGLRIDAVEREAAAARRAVRPTRSLFGSDDPGDIAELQWRISVPLMGVLLVALAVPLARSSPRQGRYAKLFAAILVYVLYSNLLGVSQIWVEREQLSPWIGLWWVHAAVLLGFFGLVINHYGWKHVK